MSEGKNKRGTLNHIFFLAIAAMLCTFLSLNLMDVQAAANDYADTEMWAYWADGDEKEADCFLICPTVYFAEEGQYNLQMDNYDGKADFLGALNMEKGIYSDDCRMFAPYYRQASLEVYDMEKAESDPYFDLAYQDIKESFDYYMENKNDGRAVVLAGFSQGAQMCLRLLEEEFDNLAYQDKLAACYAIGWRITEEELNQYPHLKFATGESDVGVIVAFNSEAENVDDSLMIPKGTKTLAINPLNWKTDGTVADKSLNLGACFTDYSGGIITEIPNLTGAYIDETRGALKVTDVTPKDYPPVLSIFQDGIYHLYDYQFFYRNLQSNVHTRVEAYRNAA